MKKHIFLTIVVFLASSLSPMFAQHGPAADDEDVLEICDFENTVSSYVSPFELSWGLDVPLAVGGVGVTAGSIAFGKVHDDSYYQEIYKESSFTPEDVNPFDRLCIFPENKTVSDIGTDISLAQLVLVPAAAFGTQAVLGHLGLNDCMKVGVMYAESFFLSYGMQDMLNLVSHRARPYMYSGEAFDLDDVDQYDFTSFPSGHTTLASMSAAFTTYVFSTYYPDSVWKIPVTAVSWGLTGATMITRVASGRHFMTDVLAGCALGTAVGFLVPWSHKLVADLKNQKKDEGGVALKGITILPMGVAVSISF